MITCGVRISRRCFQKILTGNRFPLSRPRRAWPWLWVNQQSPAPYVIKVKVPSGVKLMPHIHPEDRVYTIISGVFYIGLGDEFDADKLQAYPPGSVIVLPGNTPHLHWAKSGGYVSQVTAIGPLGLDYMNAADDPRVKTNKDFRR